MNRNFQKLFDAHRLLQALAKGGAFDTLHHQENLAIVLEHVKNRGQVGVIERRGALGFLQKSLSVPLIKLKFWRHSLDSDDPFEGTVLSTINLSHTAHAQALPDREPAHRAAGKVASSR